MTSKTSENQNPEQKTTSRPPKPAFDVYYLAIAHAVSWRSSCSGAPVGAVLVKGNRIIATGFNGTPQGWKNCDEGGCQRCSTRGDSKQQTNENKEDVPQDKGHDQDETEDQNRKNRSHKDLDLCVCVHAEVNVLATAARFGIPVGGSEMFVTDLPCMQCAKSLIQAGVERVTYSRHYEVAKPEDEEAKRILADHHQLSRELKARKLNDKDVALELGVWLSWLRSESCEDSRRTDLSAKTTALQDVQFSQGRIEGLPNQR